VLPVIVIAAIVVRLVQYHFESFLGCYFVLHVCKVRGEPLVGLAPDLFAGAPATSTLLLSP
jgi:hypothetical protein